ncbi:MAG: glycosyltransferase family 4 protein [Gemmataceae bacterium]
MTGRLTAAVRRWVSGDRDEGFDVTDLAAVNALLGPHGIPPFTSLPTVDGERAARLFAFRPDLRDVFPLGLTPHTDRGRYLLWLAVNAAAEYGLTPAEAVAHLAALDRTPDRGLAATYRMQPSWQEAVPDALTPAGWPMLVRYVKERYTVTDRWLSQARLPAPDSRLPTPGVNLFAHFRHPCGLQQAALALADAAGRAGLGTSLRDLPADFPGDLTDRTPYDGLEEYDVSVVVAGINSPPMAYLERCGAHLRPGVKRAAVLYWESDRPPADLADRLRGIDEVWAPTRFVTDALRPALSIPVVPLLPGIELPAVAPARRDDARFQVLFAFDMASLMARKNPLGLIAAFRRAFRRDEPADLVLKVSRGEQCPGDLAELIAACRDSGVTLIDRHLPRSELLGLMAACDCYASLHRAEGFGLGMAEAMLLGKPVIATRYSGNLDFLTDDTGYLVDCELVPVPAGTPYPPGASWAEPSVEHAAVLLRRVYERREEAREKAERGRDWVQREMSLAAAGRRLADRVQSMRDGRRG